MSTERLVCVVDDDDAIRESLRVLLFTHGIACRCFASAAEFLDQGPQLAIHCLLLDIRMPGMDGLELFDRLRQQKAAYPIVFITGHGDIPLAVDAIKNGAHDFLTKPFRDGELIKTVQSAFDAFQRTRNEMERLEVLQDRAGSLTPREREVMKLMAQGLPNKGVADELNISPRTVEIHRAHVMEKMCADSLPALVRMVSQLGIDSPDQ